MKLTEELKQQLSKKLKELGINLFERKCQLCEKSDWDIGDTIFEVREFRAGSLYVIDNVQPLIPITCLICGNTILLNAFILDILDSEKLFADITNNLNNFNKIMNL
jgi:hypothetical protein